MTENLVSAVAETILIKTGLIHPGGEVPPVIWTEVHQQKTLVDCGVYVAWWIYIIVTHKSLDRIGDFKVVPTTTDLLRGGLLYVVFHRKFPRVSDFPVGTLSRTWYKDPYTTS